MPNHAETLSPTELATSQPPDQIRNVPALRWLYMYISESCNLACKHCWLSPLYDPKGKSGTFIKLEHVQAAIEQAKPLGLSNIKLTGGEPTLHPQLAEIMQFIHAANIRITMETNGVLVDDELAGFMAAHGLSFVSVSLDGASAETHNFVRGVADSYDRAIEGVKALVRAGTRPQLICTLNRANISEVPDLIDLAANLGCQSLKINILQYAGRAEKFSQEYGLSVPEVIEFSEHMQEVSRRDGRLPIYVHVPLAFQSIGSLLTSVGTCGILNILGVLASGELSMCGIGYSIPELVYGHLDHDDLADIWSNHPHLIELRTRIPEGLEGICQQCLHRNICKGSCIANNYHLTQSLTAPYDFCRQADELGLFPDSRKVTFISEEIL